MKQLRMEFETPYQVTSLPLSNGQAIHRIAISAEGDTARVSLDPNICQLDSFGDTNVCTRIAVFMFEAKLSLLEEPEGKQLFALEPLEAEQPALRLVLRPERHGHTTSARLLVLDAAGAINAVVALEPLPRT